MCSQVLWPWELPACVHVIYLCLRVTTQWVCSISLLQSEKTKTVCDWFGDQTCLFSFIVVLWRQRQRLWKGGSHWSRLGCPGLAVGCGQSTFMVWSVNIYNNKEESWNGLNDGERLLAESWAWNGSWTPLHLVCMGLWALCLNVYEWFNVVDWPLKEKETRCLEFDILQVFMQ